MSDKSYKKVLDKYTESETKAVFETEINLTKGKKRKREFEKEKRINEIYIVQNFIDLRKKYEKT